MDTVVVLELDTPSNIRVLQPDRTPANPDQPVLRAHIAPAKPSGACGPLTMCGLDTSDMALAPQRPTSAGRRWHICTTCQSGANTAVSPATVDTATVLSSGCSESANGADPD
ncbi:hypothetical protein ACFY2K_30495 [Kitasatospora sp. NPDC001309]|uniref:hypothetical protein n=1 Tax=Kitasatospora sp. NPDC001309 TaxID=3364013 RepID=UPI0036BEB840